MKLLPLLTCCALLGGAVSMSAAPAARSLARVDFAGAQLTTAPKDRLVVGDVTLFSNKKALEIVEVAPGEKVLRFSPKGGGWLRVAFAPTAPASAQRVMLQVELKYPAGAPDKGGALRAGIYAVQAPEASASAVEDVGFMAVTNPGAADAATATTFVRDLPGADSQGKFPGFLGGGGGTAPIGKPAAGTAFGAAWTTLVFAISPAGKAATADWQVGLTLKAAGAPVKSAAVMRAAKDFPTPVFNVAGLSVGAGEVQIRVVEVSLL